MIGMGAKFAWFFTYMPVGKGAVKELMATAEQREMMYHRIREYRRTKPIFTVDFWNDGEYVGGYIAGGRCYCHINANGALSPARLSTIRIRISGKKLCWKRISRRCSWDTMTTSRGTTICSVPVRSWTIREG